MNQPSKIPDEYLMYYDGQSIQVGDRVIVPHSEKEVSIITNIFPPNHEVSVFYDEEFGCVELGPPSAILPLPIEEDIELVARGENPNPPEKPLSASVSMASLLPEICKVQKAAHSNPAKDNCGCCLMSMGLKMSVLGRLSRCTRRWIEPSGIPIGIVWAHAQYVPKKCSEAEHPESLYNLEDIRRVLSKEKL